MVTNTIRPSKAPNLPIAPVSYSQQYVDQLTNAFRLYFAQLDNFTQSIGGPLGGKYLEFPHVAASDSTDQYATASDTPTIIKWNTLDYAEGFTLNVDNTATALNAGIYKIDYSLQLINTDNVAHDANVWLRITSGGITTDVAASTSQFSVSARKSTGVYSYVVAYSSVVFELGAGDSVGLWWATNQAYSTTGPVDGVYIEHKPAQTSPYIMPSIPSSIGSITFVSEITA